MNPEEGRGVAAWRGLVAAAAVVAVIAGMRAAAVLIVPFLLALSIAIICLPPLAWMERRRVPTPLAVLILLVVIVAALIGFGIIIGQSTTNLIGELPQYQQQFQGLLNDIAALGHRFGLDISVAAFRKALDPDSAFGLVATFFKSFGALLGNSALIIITVLFLLFEASIVPRKLASLPKEDPRHGSLAVFRSFIISVQRYVGMKTLTSIGTGVVTSLALWAIGVHYALLWGLLAFLFNFVPAIGAFISAIPAVILAYLQGGLPLFLVTIVIYVVINTAFGSFIEPKLMGQRLGLSTLVVWASLIIWGWVLGPVGMLLSVPLTMIFKIGFESYPETRWIALMLGPAPRPPQDGWIFRLWHRRRH